MNYSYFFFLIGTAPQAPADTKWVSKAPEASVSYAASAYAPASYLAPNSYTAHTSHAAPPSYTAPVSYSAPASYVAPVEAYKVPSSAYYPPSMVGKRY